MKERDASNILVDLLGHKGRLKMITSEVDLSCCGGNGQGSHSLYCHSSKTPLDPAYFIQHDIVRIEKDKESLLRAWTEEGDWCRGEPAALLARLTEHDVLGISNTRG